ACARTSAPLRQWRRVLLQATYSFASLESAESSSGKKCLCDFFLLVDADPQLLDIDVLIRSVSHVNRARPEQQRLAPVRQQWNVRRICDWSGLEPGYRRESLGRD